MATLTYQQSRWSLDDLFSGKPEEVDAAFAALEQSVSAMMPCFTSGISGESSAYALPTQPFGRPENNAPMPAAVER